MSDQLASPDLDNVRPITFPNGGRANAAVAASAACANEVLKWLNIARSDSAPGATILILGGQAPLDEAVATRLTTVLYGGVVPAAIEAKATLIGSAVKSGASALVGRRAINSGAVSIGVAPLACVRTPSDDLALAPTTLDPGHTHIVLGPGEHWGDECDMIDALARELVPASRSVVAVLAGCDEQMGTTALRWVQRHWPLVVLEGTGGLADRIVETRKKSATPVADPVVAELAASRAVYIFGDDARPETLQRLILQRLGRDPTLALAWDAFNELDGNAVSERSLFERTQLLLLVLGVTAVILGLLKAIVSTGPEPQGLEGAVILVPILTTLWIAVTTRYKHGPRWILLRGGAEAIKSEIYQYRARARDYAGPDREKRLSREVTSIREHLSRTELKELALRPPRLDGPPKAILDADDDGISLLSPEEYVQFRLHDQARFYRSSAARLDARFRLLLVASLVLGGLATFLAAVGFGSVIAVTTAVIAAITSYLGYQQVEFTLSRYTQSAMGLSNIEAWWTALSGAERRDVRKIYRLFDATEDLLKSELTGWVQQMRDALAHLHDDTDTPNARDGGNEPSANGTSPDTDDLVGRAASEHRGR